MPFITRKVKPLLSVLGFFYAEACRMPVKIICLQGSDKLLYDL